MPILNLHSHIAKGTFIAPQQPSLPKASAAEQEETIGDQNLAERDNIAIQIKDARRVIL